MENINDSILLRNLQDKEKPQENEVKSINEENIIKPRALRLESLDNSFIETNNNNSTNNNLIYNPNINYYEEYWKLVCDNEYLTAQIKENMVEIESMKAHIQQLTNQ